MRTICASLFLLVSSAIYAEAEKPHEIVIEIKIQCPTSEEYNQFVASIPKNSGDTSTYDEFKYSFTNNMTQLNRLVESGQIHDAWWTVKTDEGKED